MSYEDIYKQDQTADQPHIWIQWKGTRICCDVHCKCGHQGHIDGMFFYYYKCPCCNAIYAVGQIVKLIELTPEQAAEAQTAGAMHTDECET